MQLRYPKFSETLNLILGVLLFLVEKITERNLTQESQTLVFSKKYHDNSL